MTKWRLFWKKLGGEELLNMMCPKAKHHNKSEKHCGYPKRYLKSHIQNIDFRYLKHFAFF